MPLTMTPQRSQRLECRLADFGIVYDPDLEAFTSYDGPVDWESILAVMPDVFLEDVAAFVERKRMYRQPAWDEAWLRPTVRRLLSHNLQQPSNRP